MRFLEVLSMSAATSLTSPCNSKGAWLERVGWAKWIRDFTTSLPRRQALPMLW
jgi:hypothetical protein